MKEKRPLEAGNNIAQTERAAYESAAPLASMLVDEINAVESTPSKILERVAVP